MKKIITLMLLILLLFACQTFEGPQIILKEGELLKIKNILNSDKPFYPKENPLKGFVVFQNSDTSFPHSMEFFAFPLSKIIQRENTLDFSYFEKQLKDIASRGNQAVCRPYLDYPGEKTGIPQYLIDKGLKINKYTEHNGGLSPDYSDEDLVLALENFLEKWAQKYDGDPRLGYITMGILGHWGEWHTWPNAEIFAPQSTQQRVIKAYEKSFTQTRLLLRIPHPYAENSHIGFHDDSFAWSTLPPTDWHFGPQLQQAGLSDAWKTRPIGGEIRPDIQALIWNKPKEAPEDYALAVKTIHPSWLINQAVFEPGYKKWSKNAQKKALEANHQLGYNYMVKELQITQNSDTSCQIELQLENQGIAPFYYQWPIKFRITNKKKILIEKKLDYDIRNLLPKQINIISDDFQIEQNFQSGIYQIWIKIENPLVNGKPLLLLNPESQNHQKGWIPIYSFEIKRS